MYLVNILGLFQKNEVITKAVHEVVKEPSLKPKKCEFNKGSEFHNSLMKSYLQYSDNLTKKN